MSTRCRLREPFRSPCVGVLGGAAGVKACAWPLVVGEATPTGKAARSARLPLSAPPPPPPLVPGTREPVASWAADTRPPCGTGRASSSVVVCTPCGGPCPTTRNHRAGEVRRLDHGRSMQEVAHSDVSGAVADCRLPCGLGRTGRGHASVGMLSSWRVRHVRVGRCRHAAVLRACLWHSSAAESVHELRVAESALLRVVGSALHEIVVRTKVSYHFVLAYSSSELVGCM